MTLPQNLVRAMRIIVSEWDELHIEDAPAMGAAVEVLRGYVNREDGRAKVKRKVGGRKPTSKPTGPSEATREAVRLRSRGWCEVGSLGCHMKAVHMHHRLQRSQGGGHGADNLLHVCRACHDLIHAEPQWSYERGWLLHRETV